MIEAIVYDSDGTLVDTIELVRKGLQQLATENGHAEFATDSHVNGAIGGSVARTIAKLLQIDEHDETIPDLAIRLDEIQDAGAPEWVSSYSKVTSTLDMVKAMGIKQAIFSSGTRYQVDRNLRAVDIEPAEMFDVIASHEHFDKSKPDPEGLEYCLRKLGVFPEEVIYIGDHDVDIKAGKAIGVKTVGISHGFHGEEDLKNAGADHIIHNMSELLDILELY